MKDFEKEVIHRIRGQGGNRALKEAARRFMEASTEPKYSYNFSWLGRPIIQYPQDIVAMQEIVWALQPDLVLEMGIAHGGSLILYASLLELNSACGGPRDARVLGVDIDIRSHNRTAIEAHPLARRIEMIQGSSIDPNIVGQVRERASKAQVILVCLDSNHTHEHALAELEAYAPLVSPGSYCVVFDTIIEDLPEGFYPDRPWDKGNNPKTAVHEFLETHPEFSIDREVDDKLLISVAPEGYLKRSGSARK